MLKLTENIWIGNSTDEAHADLDTEGIGAVLVVAHDLQPTRGWKHGAEYAQVGIVDGPGNPVATYHAAVLALYALLKRHQQVLVCCHNGGRSLAITLMYMQLRSGLGWGGCLEMLGERVDGELPVPHEAHRRAFDRINWRLLSSVMED